MKRRSDCRFTCTLASLLALLAIPQVAHAEEHSWASRSGSYLAQPGDPLDWYQRRALGYQSTLEKHWEGQRFAQQQSAQIRSHAWFGNYAGYYAGQFRYSAAPFTQINSTPQAQQAGCRGDVLDDLYLCDSLERIDFNDLCGDRSASECLEALRHAGRR